MKRKDWYEVFFYSSFLWVVIGSLMVARLYWEFFIICLMIADINFMIGVFIKRKE